MALPDAHLEAACVSGDDCVLRCIAAAKPGVRYRAVRWYKVGEPPSSHLSGILTKDLPNGTTRWYTVVDRQTELLDESHTMLLPNVTCSDSGTYTCHLAAPVGEQNQDGKVLLTIADCSDSPTKGLLTNAYMVIVASAVLMFAFGIFFMSYVCLKNSLKDNTSKKETLSGAPHKNKDLHNPLKDKHHKAKKETSLDAPLKPLDREDLMLIRTLGPKQSKTPTADYICV